MIDIEKESQISMKNQRKLIRWFSRQNYEIWIEVFREQKKYFFKMKNMHDGYDLIDLTLLSYITALSDISFKINSKSTKRRESNLKDIKSSIHVRSKQMKICRKRDKYERLLNLKSVIFQLHTIEKMSFYQISNYLKKWHKLEVSHTYLRKFYNLMQKGEENV